MGVRGNPEGHIFMQASDTSETYFVVNSSSGSIILDIPDTKTDSEAVSVITKETCMYFNARSNEKARRCLVRVEGNVR